MQELGHLAIGSLHSEVAGDHIAQRIAGMTPQRIGFIDFREHVPAQIGFPVYPFEIRNQLGTTGVDPQSALAGLIVQHRVYTVQQLELGLVQDGVARAIKNMMIISRHDRLNQSIAS